MVQICGYLIVTIMLIPLFLLIGISITLPEHRDVTRIFLGLLVIILLGLLITTYFFGLFLSLIV